MNWDVLTTNMPEGVEVFPDGDEAVVRFDDNELTVVWNDGNNSFTINGKTLHFEDIDLEVIGTILIPYILQELDGERRI